MASAELEAEEVLECARQVGAPVVRRHARQRDAVDQDTPGRRLVELAEQLDECRLARAVLADDGDDRARGQREIDAVEHHAVGAGIRKRHALESDALGQP